MNPFWLVVLVLDGARKKLTLKSIDDSISIFLTKSFSHSASDNIPLFSVRKSELSLPQTGRDQGVYDVWHRNTGKIWSSACIGQ